MRRWSAWIAAAAICAGAWPASARPLITQEVETLGLFMFETQIASSRRSDDFGTPQKTYQTVHMPVTIKMGIHRRMDLGFTSQYLSHRLKTGEQILKGSIAADFAAHLKYAFTDHAGILATFYQSENERSSQTMPIGHGNDYELMALFKWPAEAFSLHLNSGVLWKGRYNAHSGVLGGLSQSVEPGNIIQNRVSLEVPARWNISLLAESAYYRFRPQRIDGLRQAGTSGEAWDGLLGLTWAYTGWNLGAGAGTSFLKERSTSFDLIRGMGDTFFKFSLAYQLQPRRPDW